MTAKAKEAPEPMETTEPEQPKISFGTYADIRKRLLEPIPDRLISVRPQGGAQIRYVSVSDYKDMLDVRAGLWESSIVEFKQIGESLCVNVRIAIHADDGVFCQDGSGIEPMNTTSYGDPFSNAYAQGFRRACEGHGLSRELWRSESSQSFYLAYQERQHATDEPNTPEPQPKPEPQQAAEHFAKKPDMPPSATEKTDYIGHGEAKKKELKLRGLCKSLNEAGLPVPLDPYTEPMLWSPKTLNQYCVSGFDTALRDLDKQELEILLTDLNDILQERLAIAGESPADNTPEFSGPGPVTEAQLSALAKLCDIKGLKEADVANETTEGNKTTFAEMTEPEAGAAIQAITKM